MTTKEQVLKLLKNNGTEYISGQDLADKLFVSRAAVWKAITSLRKDGANIEAVTNRGYRYIKEKPMPDAKIIRELLTEKKSNIKYPDIEIFECVESTNDTAKLFYRNEPDKERIIISGKQTKGRGRRGREFFSPDKTGIYLSMLLIPNVSFTKAVKFTCMAAVAICRAIEEVTGISPDIKWVNDIYYKDKKIAGILTEGETSMEDGSVEYVIIGIGINLYRPYDGFPEEIKNTAGALLNSSPDADVINKLYAAAVFHFYDIYMNDNNEAYIPEYKRRSMLIGRYIKIIRNNENDKKSRNNYALAEAIDDSCRLIIKYDDGRRDILSSGEVSVVKY